MSDNSEKGADTVEKTVSRFRLRFGRLLGIKAARKGDLYVELSHGATLFDTVYWLQIFFSAGIATLGLVMNSPAVIIGAMLISPLMGPILAAGLALSSGDMILGLRSATKIFMSCALAVAFTALLVLVLPFREMTDEIAARTRPNTLDLVIALFSGAVGSIAVCRDIKGVATSIPGVAIAVALMPPLCVAGYGLGSMLTRDAAWGWEIASGGGLLFLTNLVTITFTAMLVFLAVNLSTRTVMERAEKWARNDPESSFILNLIARSPRIAQAREIRSLPVRFLMILIPLVVITVPLSRAFDQMQSEIAQQQRENTMRNVITDIWQQNFARSSDGRNRSTIDMLSVAEEGNSLNIAIRIFHDEPYTADEKEEFARLVAAQFKRDADTVRVRLTEIPTTNVLAAIRERSEKRAVPSVSEMEASLLEQFDSALSNVRFPPDARLVSRQLVMDGNQEIRLNITYLCDVALEPEVQQSVIETIRSNLKDSSAEIRLERIATDVGLVEFPRRSSTIPILGMIQLDYAGRVMRENEELALAVSANRADGEDEKVIQQRMLAITEYLESRWQIDAGRVLLTESDQTNRTRIAFKIKGEALAPSPITSDR